MKRIILTAGVLLWVVSMAAAQPPDSNLPADFPNFSITQHGETAPGFLFGSSNSSNEEVGSYFMILEDSGQPIFYSQTQGLGTLLCNGLFASRTEIQGMRKKYTWYLRDATFTEVDSFQMGNGYLADNHDFQLLPNGHVLMLCYDSQIVDMSRIVEGGSPIAQVTGSVIQELDVYQNVVFQWRSWDHIPITDSYANLTRSRLDYIHVNSVELDELDGNIILSCRETSEIIKISRVTGEVIWRMGGKHNDFTFLNEHEENAPRYFKVQHDARRHPTGTLSLFDNGADKNDLTRPYSRGVEYALDEEGMTATMVWEFRHDPDIVALSGGNTTRLPNGNTIVRWGGAAKEGLAPAMTEVDPNGQLVYEIWMADEGVTGGFSRCMWPLESLSVATTHYEIAEGNTYDEGEPAVTGVTIRVNSYDGDGYNAVTVERTPLAPLYPEFPGRAPRVLPMRVQLSGSAITAINAELSFDVESFGFVAPETLTVHHRESVGQGVFLPCQTSHNPVTNKLRATVDGFGEVIFAFPDLEPVAYAPILIEPGPQATVNQELPVSLFWTPRGFANTYHVQVATDPEFSALAVDEPALRETRYLLENVEANALYHWRVSTTNEAGTGEWSQDSFETVPPMIQVTIPNGGEQWQRGLEYFIRWEDNIDEDVVIELFRGETSIGIIDTAASIGAYQWEVDLDLEPGEDYTIRVKSAVDEALLDISDAPFAVVDVTTD